MAKFAIQVLLIAQDAKALGGVTNYLRILRERLRSEGLAEAKRFTSGRRHRERGIGRMVARIAFDHIRFWRIIKHKRFDVLQINPSLDMASFPRDAVYAFICGLAAPQTRIILFYRGWNWATFGRMQANPLARTMVRMVHAKVDIILVLSESFRQALIGTGVPASRVLTTTTLFDGQAIAGATRAVERNPRRILFLARFIPTKGAAQLIEAFAALAHQFPDAELVMAGDGAERGAIQERVRALGIEKAVQFPGYLRGEAKYAELARCSIFVLPSSHAEGMPNAILEAMAAGAVVITSGVGGIREISDHRPGFHILDSLEPTAVADALRPFLLDPVATARAGTVNAELAWDRWEAGKVAHWMAQRYSDLTNAAGGMK